MPQMKDGQHAKTGKKTDLFIILKQLFKLKNLIKRKGKKRKSLEMN